MSKKELAPTDPVLVEAIAEIEAIMKKNEIGGFAIVVSKTHAHYINLFPKWSFIQIVDGRMYAQLQAKNFKSPKEQQECADQSIGCLMMLRDQAVDLATKFIGMANEMKKHFQIEHSPFSGHVEIDPITRKPKKKGS